MHTLLTKKELKLFKEKNIKKNNVLFYENEECKYIVFVKKGSIVIKSYIDNGKEITYNTINKGEIFGNNLIFSDKHQYLGNVIAEDDSTVLLVSKENFIQILEENKQFLKAYLSHEANVSKNLNIKIKLLSIDKARDRFLYYLSVNNNEIEYHTISSLASLLSLQRETLSRLINNLEKNKIIIKKNKKIRRL